MMIIGNDLSMTKKKLDYLRIKMCRGVHLRRVVMSLSVMGANHRLKGREPSLYLDYQTLQMHYM